MTFFKIFLDVSGFFFEDSLSDCFCISGSVRLAASLLHQHTFAKFAWSVTQRQLTWASLSISMDICAVKVSPPILELCGTFPVTAPQLCCPSRRACEPGSSVGIAADYGAGRSGDRIPVGRYFSHTQPPVQWVPGLSRG
jgi:hypothetical protein